MSQPTGEGQQSGQTDPSQQSGTGEPGTGTDPNSATGGQQSGQDPQSGQGNQDIQAQLEQLKQKLSLSDRRAQEAERKLTEKERAEMGELDRTKAERDDLKQQLMRANETIKTLQLDTAFLKDNTYEWHDPAAALRLADLGGVEYKDDGTVNGLKDALKRLAEANPWLLKPKDGNDGGSGQQGQQQPARRTIPMNNTGQQTGTDRTALENKFPALKGRVTAN